MALTLNYADTKGKKTSNFGLKLNASKYFVSNNNFEFA